MAKKKSSSSGSVSVGVAVVALIVNLIIPGLGTVIWGKKQDGIYQLVLLIVGSIVAWIAFVPAVGGILRLIAWIWALVSSIQIIKSAK